MVQSASYGEPDSYDKVEWRRGRIKYVDLESDDDDICVYLLDEGYEWQKIPCEQIMPVDMLPANHNFRRFDFQARLCRLKDARPRDGRLQWSYDAINFFRNLMNIVGLMVTKCERIEMTSEVNSMHEHIYEVEICVK